MPKTDAEKVAEARAFTRARKAKERKAKRRAHNKKMLDAVRAGDRAGLKKLMAINPEAGPTRRELRGWRPMRDLFFGKSVSRTYVSEIILDEGGDFTPGSYFEGYHRGQS